MICFLEKGPDAVKHENIASEQAAPLGVDDAIMTRLEEACAAAIEDPDFVTFMNNNGQAISYLDAQGYADYLKQAAVDVAAAMDAVGL